MVSRFGRARRPTCSDGTAVAVAKDVERDRLTNEELRAVVVGFRHAELRSVLAAVVGSAIGGSEVVSIIVAYLPFRWATDKVWQWPVVELYAEVELEEPDYEALRDPGKYMPGYADALEKAYWGRSQEGDGKIVVALPNTWKAAQVWRMAAREWRQDEFECMRCGAFVKPEELAKLVTNGNEDSAGTMEAQTAVLLCKECHGQQEQALLGEESDDEGNAEVIMMRRCPLCESVWDATECCPSWCVENSGVCPSVDCAPAGRYPDHMEY
jgi:hypothetical protein